MLASVPGNNACIKEEYNICSDRCITFEGKNPELLQHWCLDLGKLLVHGLFDAQNQYDINRDCKSCRTIPWKRCQDCPL